MFSFQNKHLNSREERELLKSTDYSQHEFKVYGFPKLIVEFPKLNREPLTKRKNLLYSHRIQPFQEKIRTNNANSRKSNVVISRRRTTDILITQNLLKKHRDNSLLPSLQNTFLANSQAPKMVNNVANKQVKKIKKPLNNASLSDRSSCEELVHTLQRIDLVSQKFNPLSPQSLETRRDRIFNLVSQGVYRLYGMDHLNQGKVRNILETKHPSEPEKVIPNKTDSPILKSAFRNIDYGNIEETKLEVFQYEDPLFQFDPQLEAFTYRPCHSQKSEFKEMNIQKNQIPRAEEIRSHAEKILKDVKLSTQSIGGSDLSASQSNVPKKSFKMKKRFKPIEKPNFETSSQDSVSKQSQKLERMCNQFTQETRKMKKKIKSTQRCYKALMKHIKIEESLVSLGK